MATYQMFAALRANVPRCSVRRTASASAAATDAAADLLEGMPAKPTSCALPKTHTAHLDLGGGSSMHVTYWPVAQSAIPQNQIVTSDAHKEFLQTAPPDLVKRLAGCTFTLNGAVVQHPKRNLDRGTRLLTCGAIFALNGAACILLLANPSVVLFALVPIASMIIANTSIKS